MPPTRDAIIRAHKHSVMLPVLRTGLIVVVIALGCTGPREYVHNGFKVGPNYCQPAAPVADTWIDANDQRVRQETVDISRWWRSLQ